MTAPVRTVGIVGAGKLGTTLARLFVDAGLDVRVAGRGTADDVQFILDVLVPGARGASVGDVLADSDAVVLALPFGAVPDLVGRVPAGTLVVDATNYWAPTDGAMPLFATENTMSESVAAALPHATVVKSFNHLGYHDLDQLAHAPSRAALAVAGDDPMAAMRIARLVEAAGFEPVLLPRLAAGAAVEVGTPAFGRPMSAADLGEAVEQHAAERMLAS